MKQIAGRIACSLVTCLLAAAPGKSEQSSSGHPGSICLLSIADPTPGEKSLFNYTAGNPEPDYSVRFGESDLVHVPHSPKGKGPGLLLTDMPLDRTYMAKVYWKTERIESFPFRFEPDQQGRLCFFLNEFYVTWQLWPASRMPACSCKGAVSKTWK